MKVGETVDRILVVDDDPSHRAMLTAVLGEAPPQVGESPWMDSAFLATAGVDTVVFGPAGAGAHSAVEWVDLDSVQKTAEVLALSAVDYCGVSD